MKNHLFHNIFCAILLFSSIIQIPAQAPPVKKAAQNKAFTIKAKVDRRFELLSIIARLAGYEEYVSNIFKIYADDVDKHFGKYKEHPAVQTAVKLRETNSIGFDAVASMAVHLNENLTPKVKFTDSVPDKRWGKKNAEQFSNLLQQFYRDTDCEGFFKSHAELYKLSEERFQKLLNTVDFGWFQSFYGELPKGSFNLYVGLLDGPNNFGPKVIYPNGAEELFALIGTWEVDKDGLPVYDEKSLPLIIHEFNHSFINHLVAANEKNFQVSGERIFSAVSEKMKRNAYGNWRTVVNESLVRAAVIRYLFEHEKRERTYAELSNERNRGFLWMEELFVLLGTYENTRNTYPTFRSFIPTVQGYYSDLAKRIDDKIRVFDEMTPKIVAIDAFSNGAQDVDPKLKQITFTFDRPLTGKGYSINWGVPGKEHFGITKVIGYSADNTKVTVDVELKPDWDYEFILTGLSFKSRDGYPLQNYSVKFKTKKE